MNSKAKRFLSIILVVLIVLTVIFIWRNSAMSREQSSQMSNSLLEWLRPSAEFMGIFFKDDVLLRKLAHLLEYAALGVELAVLAFVNDRKKLCNIIYCVALCVAIAAVDEIIQLNVGRNGHIHDVMLDTFGAVCGAFGAYGICIRFCRNDK